MIQHYDCKGQQFKCEVFYGAATQLELLGYITGWWIPAMTQHPGALINHIQMSLSEEGEWSAEVHWSP